MNGHDADQLAILVESVRQQLDALSDGLENRVLASPAPAYVGSLGQAFWERCGEVGVDRRWVDGYFGQCNWNTAVAVLRSVGIDVTGNFDLLAASLASNLKVYRGYGYFLGMGPFPGGWCEHTWCMDGDCVVESTGPFAGYFGAELNEEELAHYAEGLQGHDPAQGHSGMGWTVDEEGHRIYTDAANVTDNIGLPKTYE